MLTGPRGQLPFLPLHSALWRLHLHHTSSCQWLHLFTPPQAGGDTLDDQRSLPLSLFYTAITDCQHAEVVIILNPVELLMT